MMREYKDSCIEWIGKVPLEWEIYKAKYILKKLERPIINNDIVTCFRDGEVTKRINRRTEGFTISSKEVGYQGVKKGDLVIHEMDAFAGAIGISDSNGKCTPVYIICNEIIAADLNYYSYLFRYMADSGFISYLSQGIRKRSADLRYSKFKEIEVPYFKYDEQRKISSFLNQKTAEIDEIINKKETLIEHLEKYKKSVITEAVTKGRLGDKYINEDGELVDEVEMKDSGVEWIGEIPNYWDVKKVKHSFQVINGSTPKTSNESYWNGNIVWITPADLDDNKKYISNSSRQITFEGLYSCSTNLIPKNNLIISSRAPIGYISINKVEVSTNQGCKSLVNISDENTEFYYYYFLSIRKVLNYYGNGTTFTELSASDLSQVDIISLNKSVQDVIINYLSEKTEEIDDFIQKTKKSIDKYKEYKKSLIFEAVTGKIDLRDYELEGGEELDEHNNSSEIERECISAVD